MPEVKFRIGDAVIECLHSNFTELVNKHDYEECDLCAEIGDICLYHQGVYDGQTNAIGRMYDALQKIEEQ